MEITEVNVRPVHSVDKLRAYASVVFDGAFKVNDLKVIEREDGRLLLCMPERELGDRCPCCRASMSYRHARCHSCGTQVDPDRVPVDPVTNRRQYYTGVAYPIVPGLREEMERRVFAAYRLACEYADPVNRVCDECGAELDLRAVVNLRGVCLSDASGKRRLYCAGACWAGHVYDVAEGVA